MEFDVHEITRENIKNLKPYSSARNEYTGKEGIFLDANENSYGSPLETNYHRYPDPMQLEVKEKIGKIKGLPIQNIFLGNGSDEAIDILFRAFCKPGIDNVIICPPTYGMYEVSAHINEVHIIKVPHTSEAFQLDIENIIKAIGRNTKLIFICCPNNPTGNVASWATIKSILKHFKGIVVIDEAYINFSSHKSLIPKLLNYPNLVILQTFSKAWGLAGLRVGMAFASQDIIDIFNKIKPPYNISSASQKLIVEALKNTDTINKQIKTIVAERKKLSQELSTLTCVKKVYPSEANFLLVKVKKSLHLYHYLLSKKIIVRNRGNVELCEDCLRITVGTKEENKLFIDLLKQYK